MQNNFSFERYSSLVIHTPHAGTLLPFRLSKRPHQYAMLRNRLHPYYRVLTDHYTDKLFAADIWLSGRQTNFRWAFCRPMQHVSFAYSRLFCDVERMIDDPLEKVGLGICYDWSGIIHAPVWCISKEQAMTLYAEHHQRLALAIRQSHITMVLPLLLDCHSFSEQDNILSPNAHEYKNIDICLGFNEDDTKPSLETLDCVADFFKDRGYRVAFNKPFSNSKTVDTNIPYHSLMIELNKRCYMNEDTLEITSGYYKFHSELQELYSLLLN